MKYFILFIVTTILMSPFSFAQRTDAFAVQTRIQHGIIEGDYDTRTGIQYYLGIPYAKPPVDELRWRAPQELAAWEGVKETKKFGPRAMQKLIFGDMRFRSDGVSEDCLYLNVWTPASRDTRGLPVLVYFYGGGYVAGDGSEARYDGESMAQKGIVAVTVNYRLNVFGFLAHPELSAEAPYKASGNYGLLDQVAALKWVAANIEAFGGDPNKITIAGESAGSVSVSMQMASPLAKDLLAGAIGESGAGIYPTLAPVSLEEAEKTGLEFAAAAGYPSLSELRALSSRDIYEIYNESERFGFPTVIDGHFMPKSLPEIFQAGEQAQIPLLLGWNSAEIPGFAFTQGPYSEEAYLAKIKEEFPEQHTKALELYPAGSIEEIEYSATALASDRFISYSTWKWFDLHRKHSDQAVYRYLYSKLRPAMSDSNPMKNSPPMPNAIGAPHACEIEYCMGNLRLIPDFVWTADDYKVSQTMQDYFANFIKTGNPNGEGLPHWPSVEANDQQPPVMILDVESKSQKAQLDARYEWLDQIYSDQ